MPRFKVLCDDQGHRFYRTVISFDRKTAMRDAVVLTYSTAIDATEVDENGIEISTKPAASEIQQVGNKEKPKDEDDFYKFLLMEIIDYEHLRSGWKEDSKEFAAYDLVVRQLQKVKAKYIEPTK